MEKLQEYFNDVFRLRREIYDMMRKHGVTTAISEVDINPWHNQIVDNGGIGLEFYCEYPKKIYTPFGELPITIRYVSGGNTSKILEQLICEYGAIMVKDNKVSCNLKKKDIYAITKLPWRSEELPVFQMKTDEQVIPYIDVIPVYSRLTIKK